MKNKTEIRYWLKGEEVDLDILATEPSKIPQKGEIINFGHRWNYELANRVYSDLDEKQKETFFPKEETLLNGEYIVTQVTRYITVDYARTKIPDIFPGTIGMKSSTSVNFIAEIPVSFYIEVFEVFIEPFKNSELTESPIAKVRNLLGPITQHFTMLEMQEEYKNYDEDVKKAMEKLMQENIKLCITSMEKLTRIIKDDKNWE